MGLINIKNRAWAIMPDKLRDISALIDLHRAGNKLDLKALEASLLNFSNESGSDGKYEVVNGVAIVNINGVLSKNPSAFERVLMGARSTETIKDIVISAIQDSAVEKIILKIDSPGGTVDGTQLLGDFIYENGDIKPIIGYSDGMMCSAAYWIGSACCKVYISDQTVDVGSIGVVTTHLDYSKYDEDHGFKETDIYAGKYKRIVSGNKPLSEEGEQYIQGQIDYLYGVFLESVARNRNISIDEALAMADGKVFIGEQAVEIGLVDGVSTLESIINDDSSGVGVLKNISSTNLKQENDMKTVEELKTAHPDLYNAVLADGKESAKIEIKTELETAKKNAAAAELSRVRAVLDQSVPGCEDLIQTLAFDGVTTGEQAAAQVVQFVKKENAARLAEFNESGPDAQGSSEGSDVGGNPEGGNDLEEGDDESPEEATVKVAWDKSASIRAEFRTFESYFAYVSNKKNIKILRNGGK